MQLQKAFRSLLSSCVVCLQIQIHHNACNHLPNGRYLSCQLRNFQPTLASEHCVPSAFLQFLISFPLAIPCFSFSLLNSLLRLKADEELPNSPSKETMPSAIAFFGAFLSCRLCWGRAYQCPPNSAKPASNCITSVFV